MKSFSQGCAVAVVAAVVAVAALVVLYGAAAFPAAAAIAVTTNLIKLWYTTTLSFNNQPLRPRLYSNNHHLTRNIEYCNELIFFYTFLLFRGSTESQSAPCNSVYSHKVICSVVFNF